ITTTNHKDIGTLYLWFAFTMFLVGGVLAMGIRAELFEPGLQFWHPEFFNQLTSMHGLIMVFGAIMPAFVGFAHWQVPLLIGAAVGALHELHGCDDVRWCAHLVFSNGLVVMRAVPCVRGAYGCGRFRRGRCIGSWVRDQRGVC